jgi:uncharacterized phage-associated protein
VASANDVAAYILLRAGSMSAMKLQKLVYYSQAWHLVWDEKPLFDEAIEAWANGPVVPALYRQHRGLFTLAEWRSGDPDALTRSQRETVDLVLSAYGKYSAQQLSELTHRELPWIEARRGLGPTERSQRVINPQVMQDYYSAVAADEASDVV